MRGLWFVFLAACSFSPSSANSVSADSPTVHDDATTGSGTEPTSDAHVDARDEGPGSDDGSDCDSHGPPLIRGGSNHCGHF
jgi:hypothetical protein